MIRTFSVGWYSGITITNLFSYGYSFFNLQSDNIGLADCTAIWLRLRQNDCIKEDILSEISNRFQQVATPEHLLAYMLDHRHQLEKQSVTETEAVNNEEVAAEHEQY